MSQCCDCADDVTGESEFGRCPKCQDLLDKIKTLQENVLTLAESAWANRQDPVRLLRSLASLMEDTGVWVEARKQRLQNARAFWNRLDKTFLGEPTGGSE